MTDEITDFSRKGSFVFPHSIFQSPHIHWVLTRFWVLYEE